MRAILIFPSGNSRVINTAGYTLQRYINNKIDTTVATPLTPTHYPVNHSHRPDIFDISLLKIDNLNFHLTNLPVTVISDHTYITLNINFNVSRTYPLKPSHITNWEKFEQILNLPAFFFLNGTQGKYIKYTYIIVYLWSICTYF